MHENTVFICFILKSNSMLYYASSVFNEHRNMKDYFILLFEYDQL